MSRKERLKSILFLLTLLAVFIVLNIVTINLVFLEDNISTDKIATAIALIVADVVVPLSFTNYYRD